MGFNQLFRLSFSVYFLVLLINTCEGKRRCFGCRSRGRLGDCKDPFKFNSTTLVKDVQAIPCASGWCSKIIEGDPFGEDHDLATERSCLQRIPPDSTERCSEVEWNKRKVFACFCAGDLCNSSPSLTTRGPANAAAVVMATTLLLLSSRYVSTLIS